MGKNNYVTEKYIDEVEHYLYNGLDIKELYKEDDDKLLEPFKELLLPEEQIVMFMEDYAITSLCRIFNTKLKRIVQLNFYRDKSLNVSLRGKRVDLESVFEDNGWQYDVKEIQSQYKKNKWKYGQLDL